MTDIPRDIEDAKQVVRGMFGTAAAKITLNSDADLRTVLLVVNMDGANKAQRFSATRLAFFLLRSDPRFLRPALFIATQAYDNSRQTSYTARSVRENIFVAINGLAQADARIAAARWVYQCSTLSSPLRLDMLRKVDGELPALADKADEIQEWLHERKPKMISIKFKAKGTDREERLLQAFIDNTRFPAQVSQQPERAASPAPASPA